MFFHTIQYHTYTHGGSFEYGHFTDIFVKCPYSNEPRVYNHMHNFGKITHNCQNNNISINKTNKKIDFSIHTIIEINHIL